MNHTLENALVTGAILATFVLPVIMIAQQAKRRRRTALITTLELAARKQALQLTRFDLLDNKIIGWDQELQTVLFCYATDQKPTVIDLSHIAKCHAIIKTNGSAIRSITLQFQDRDNKSLYRLPFYEQFIDNEMHLKKTQRCCKEWEQLINANLYSRDNAIRLLA